MAFDPSGSYSGGDTSGSSGYSGDADVYGDPLASLAQALSLSLDDTEQGFSRGLGYGGLLANSSALQAGRMFDPTASYMGSLPGGIQQAPYGGGSAARLEYGQGPLGKGYGFQKDAMDRMFAQGYLQAPQNYTNPNPLDPNDVSSYFGHAMSPDTYGYQSGLKAALAAQMGVPIAGTPLGWEGLQRLQRGLRGAAAIPGNLVSWSIRPGTSATPDMINSQIAEGIRGIEAFNAGNPRDSLGGILGSGLGSWDSGPSGVETGWGENLLHNIAKGLSTDIGGRLKQDYIWPGDMQNVDQYSNTPYGIPLGINVNPEDVTVNDQSMASASSTPWADNASMFVQPTYTNPYTGVEYTASGQEVGSDIDDQGFSDAGINWDAVLAEEPPTLGALTADPVHPGAPQVARPSKISKVAEAASSQAAAIANVVAKSDELSGRALGGSAANTKQRQIATRKAANAAKRAHKIAKAAAAAAKTERQRERAARQTLKAQRAVEAAKAAEHNAKTRAWDDRKNQLREVKVRKVTARDIKRRKKAIKKENNEFAAAARRAGKTVAQMRKSHEYKDPDAGMGRTKRIQRKAPKPKPLTKREKAFVAQGTFASGGGGER